MTGTYNLRHGGLMRCCIGALDNEMVRRQQAGEPLMIEGDTLKCRYHQEDYGMVCKRDNKGVLGWQWAKPESE